MIVKIKIKKRQLIYFLGHPAKFFVYKMNLVMFQEKKRKLTLDSNFLTLNTDRNIAKYIF